MRPTWIAATFIGISAIAGSTKAAMPRVIWNASPSVPIGFYIVRAASPRRGELAVVRLGPGMPGTYGQAALGRYLHRSAFLLKPVAGIEGDRICRFGAMVLIGTHVAVRARAVDTAGRPMPKWSGCRVLSAGEVFLLAQSSASFDGRYLGVTRAERVVGTAVRVGVVVDITERQKERAAVTRHAR